ncbi:MAG: AAA family ATPase [Polyangiaceae bacterium]
MLRAWPPLLGREVEQQQIIAAVEQLIESSLDVSAATSAPHENRCRTVEISGPPGMGKSHLTRAVTDTLLRSGRAGQHAWVDLEEVVDAASATDALATALSLQHAGTQLVEALCARFSAVSSPTIVVLDHADGLLAAPNFTGETWLRRLLESLALAANGTPVLVLITSSRQLPRNDLVRIDAAFEIGPLPLPRANTDLSLHPAVQLFCNAAAKARAGYTLLAAEAPAIAGIIQALDGSPRAIELAASRMSVMAARALYQRLANAPWQQLPALERADALLLQGLDDVEMTTIISSSVFKGGFTFEAAEQVFATTSGRPLIDVLSELRQRSLLMASTSTDGELRLRAYASAVATLEKQHNSAALLNETRARHARYFSERALQLASIRIEATEPNDLATWVAREQDNLIAALDYLLATPNPERTHAQQALALTAALGPDHVDQARGERVYARLAPLLGITRASGADPAMVAEVLLLRAKVAEALGHDGASADLVRALAMAQASGQRDLEAKISLRLGKSLLEVGEVDQAQRTLEHALSLSTTSHTQAGLFEVLGRLLTTRSDPQGIELLRRSVEMARREAAHRLESDRRHLLVAAHLDLGDTSAAEVELSRLDPSAHSMVLRGQLAHEQGDVKQARMWHERAMGMSLDDGDHRTAHWAEINLAMALRDLGESALAFASLTHTRERASRPLRALALTQLAAVERDAGRDSEADELLAQAPANVPPWVTAVTDLERARAQRSTMAPVGILARLSLRCALSRDAARRTETPKSVAPPESAPSSARTTLIGPEGRWFEIAQGETVSLSRRPVLAKLLFALARKADRLMTPEELVAAGWPEERVLASAAAHRVRVAISTLRKMGLRSVLITEDDGYRLLGPVVIVQSTTDV